jgi:DNA-directed RNA polymerase specialized sigma24 family protein
MIHHTCSNGHRWDRPAAEGGAGPEPARCPHCGGSGSPAGPELNSHMSQISTHLSVTASPESRGEELLRRYQKAIRKYLHRLLRDEGRVEDAYQDLYATVCDPNSRWGGEEKFRDYLKRQVRKCAHPYRAGAANKRTVHLENWDVVADPAGDDGWTEIWSESILKKAITALRQTDPTAADVIEVIDKDPGAGREAQAAALSARGDPVTPVAFRQRLQRAKKKLAPLIRAEVALAHTAWTPAQIEAEIYELGLAPHILAEDGPGAA